jgi:DNA-binding SARP family transcriptional activator/tetratricopeptide (TPR) repeat protein
MWFSVLGPLEVIRDGKPVNVGGPRQEIVLAMLLLEANHVVPIDRLITAVWDEEPPVTARGQVQICISTLRRQVLSGDRQHKIFSRRPGYVLALEDGALDADVFEARVATARDSVQANDLRRACAEFRDALALWRGYALDGMVSRLVQHSVMRLNERRLAVLEECMNCELTLGLHQDLVEELVGLVQEHPLRERLRALLMTALYMAGRQAEALEAYRQARDTLIDELGIEPGHELQEIQQAILAGHLLPGMAEPAAIQVSAPASPPREAVQVPRLLPAAIPDFTGRAKVVHKLIAAMTERENTAEGSHAVPVQIIIGQGGVGKTTLAVHLAHKLASRFSDGQLFARLRNGDRQTNPADILERFLRAFGVTGSNVPKGTEERAEMYRNILGERRVLIVLDDAMSEQQVNTLLPGNSRCSVIVTSRKRLTGIAADRVELRGLDRQSAVQMLTSIVGQDRVQAEPDAVAALCAMCGGLPIALRIVAARLAARPHWSVSDLANRLRDDSRRLDELAHGGVGVRASISLTYKSLSLDAQRLFRMLSVFDASSFAAWVGSPLMQIDVVRAEDLLEELTEAYLIDAEPDPATGQVRYRFHDIMRPFARERLVAEESTQERQKALEDLLGALLYLAGEAHRHEYSGAFVLPTSGASRWTLPDALVSRLMKDPLAWYEAERGTLVSAVRQAAANGLVEHSWDLALSTVTLFESHAHYDDWRDTHEIALMATCRAGDRRGEATMRYSLGSLYMFERQTEEAARQLNQALTLYRQLGDRHGVALALRNIAYMNRIDGQLDLALSRWDEAVGTFQILGDRVAEAHILHNMAQVHLDFGDCAAAEELLDRAERICEDFGNRRVGAQVLHRRGELHLMCGDFDRAAKAYRRVLVAVQDAADPVGECHALLGLGTVELKRGELEAAAGTLTQAQDLAATVGDTMVRGRIALARAEAALRSDALELAAERCDMAVAAFGGMMASIMQAEALLLRGEIHMAAGQLGQAREVWQAARSTLSVLELRTTVRLAAELEARIAALG